MKNLKNSKAFSLFEIIVSIIVVGIAISAFPFIFQIISRSAKVSVKEETIYNELSLLKLILPYYFDENNTKKDNFYKDLNASGGDTELEMNSSSTYAGVFSRVGKAEFNNNIYRSGDNLDVSSIGVDSDEEKGKEETYDDIDDFDGFEENVSGHTLKVKVYYINDEANYSEENIFFKYDYNTKKNKTNIKVIKITSDNNITIFYPANNIGRSKYLSYWDLTR